MDRDSKYDILFEPVPMGPKTAWNRFYKTAHCSGFGSDWPGSQAHLRGMAAEGGWAVVNTEWCSVHPSSDDHGYVGARLWDETDVRNLSLTCNIAHEHGALVGVELTYAAMHANNYESRMPARGVSQTMSDWMWMTSCYEMTKEEIREVQGYYVDAAKRARSTGFDLINVYSGHGHPITYHFLDPFYNKRTDEYGGSFENRTRFLRETLEQVNEAVGDDCAIVVRITMDSLRKGGLELDECVAVVELADDLVDLWDLVLGGVLSEWGEETLASRFASQNYERPWLEKVRPHTKKPVVGVGRFTNPDVMVEMVKSGTLDLIGSARGSIADPFLPRKIEEGRLDDIRECIGNNICVGRIDQHAILICTQNATAGAEYRRGWHPEKFSVAGNTRDAVLVVGAGPAGMECAMVLGKRSMGRVHMVDAQEDIGGTMRWVPQLPGLGEWSRVVDYRRIQINKLKNVEFIPNARLTAQDVLEYGADIVIIATGASWARDGLNGLSNDPIPGADASVAYCLTPEQIMVEGKEACGERVLVYDCDGYFVAIGLAEKLVGEGKDVTIVTPFPQISPYSFFTLEGPRINRKLRHLGVRLWAEHTVTHIQRGRVTGSHIYHPDEPVTWTADSIVLVTQRLSNDELFRELDADQGSLSRAGVKGLYRIGDCVVPRLIADAIFDGHRLAREIDSPHPETPLPFIRENRILGATDEEYDAVLRVTAATTTPSRP